MKNSKVLMLVVGLLVIIGAVVVIVMMRHDDNEYKTGGSSSQSNSSSSNNNTQAADKVTIDNFAFSPLTTTVKVGTTVTWTNEDSAAHTVTADTPASDAPNSGSIGQNETYTFTFNKAGTYKYHCKIHPDMKATVVVTE